jgi:hypothetical protein
VSSWICTRRFGYDHAAASRDAAAPRRERMLTLVGIFMVVVVALLSNKEQRKGA